MPKPVVITADSTVDLSPELIARFDIHVIPLTITLGEDTFLDGHGFTPLDMYKRYREDGTLPMTSAPGVQEFLDFFTPLVEAGYEVVHLADGARVVAVVYREHQHVRVMVYEIVEHLASHEESGNQFARVELLLGIGYNSLLYQLYNTV